MSMAAGAVGLREVYTPDAARTLSAAGESLKQRLNEAFAQKKVAMQATGIGSLLCIHFQRTPIRRPADVDAAEEKRALFHLEMMQRGYYLARRGYMALSMVLEPRDYDGFVAAAGAIADEYASVLKE